MGRPHPSTPILHPATPTSGPPGLPVLHFITLHTPMGGQGAGRGKEGPTRTLSVHRSFPQMLLSFKRAASIHTESHEQRLH